MDTKYSSVSGWLHISENAAALIIATLGALVLVSFLVCELDSRPLLVLFLAFELDLCPRLASLVCGLASRSPPLLVLALLCPTGFDCLWRISVFPKCLQ